MSWYVYIIETKGGNLYTGITTDLQRRFAEHKQGKKGARFFHISAPEIILFQEQHPDRSKASKREYEIKKMSRKKKFELIAQAKTGSLNENDHRLIIPNNLQ